ncbi:MAG: protein-(glutamine-N5) methyltransferase, release factor-specific, partial [Buchnera aphidicola]|nr:protein-(glutamine-N5) methyltransferase, release factor-specific [Buchnera aphidicola]
SLIYRRSQGGGGGGGGGKKEFWSLSLHVSYDTLIPRPDTEILVEQALLKIKNKNFMILDLGSGCGAIALAIASTCINCQV